MRPSALAGAVIAARIAAIFCGHAGLDHSARNVTTIWQKALADNAPVAIGIMIAAG
jgi:hypothetical protein